MSLIVSPRDLLRASDARSSPPTKNLFRVLAASEALATGEAHRDRPVRATSVRARRVPSGPARENPEKTGFAPAVTGPLTMAARFTAEETANERATIERALLHHEIRSRDSARPQRASAKAPATKTGHHVTSPFPTTRPARIFPPLLAESFVPRARHRALAASVPAPGDPRVAAVSSFRTTKRFLKTFPRAYFSRVEREDPGGAGRRKGRGDGMSKAKQSQTRRNRRGVESIAIEHNE